MMKSNRWILLPAALTIVLSAQSHRADADAEEPTVAMVTVQMHLHVSYQVHDRYRTGTPPATARESTAIGFTKRGVYTLVRFREGPEIRYVAIPGLPGGRDFPRISGISVHQTHTCLDERGRIIARRGEDLSPYAEVHPGSGNLRLSSDEDDPVDLVRITIGTWDVSTGHVPCTTEPYCAKQTFHFSGEIGDESAARDEPEDLRGHRGVELAVVDWSLLKSLAEGGDAPVIVPLSFRKMGETTGDVPGATVALVYTVTGSLAPFAEPLPVPPAQEADER